MNNNNGYPVYSGNYGYPVNSGNSGNPGMAYSEQPQPQYDPNTMNMFQGFMNLMQNALILGSADPQAEKEKLKEEKLQNLTALLGVGRGKVWKGFVGTGQIEVKFIFVDEEIGVSAFYKIVGNDKFQPSTKQHFSSKGHVRMEVPSFGQMKLMPNDSGTMLNGSCKSNNFVLS